MKRHLLIIAICLLLGAVVNVAVAWGCALWSPRLAQHYGTPDEAADIWRESVGPPIYTSTLLTGEYLGCTIRDVRSGFAIAGPRRFYLARFVESGWPFRSFSGARITKVRTSHVTAWTPPSQVLALKLVNPRRDVIPLAPTWPGFALNTLFYASILWLLIPGPFVLRRFLRVKRGLCPKCAYPMGESIVCTECGKPLPRRRRMPI